MGLWEKLKEDFYNKNTIGIFKKNYDEMKEANTIGADRYFHSLANCEAAQNGGILGAKIISGVRETLDTPKNVLFKKMTLQESLEDSELDIEANDFGRQMGTKYPNLSCRVLVNKYKPQGLDEKY